MTIPKNISASVKGRLETVAKARGEDFNLLFMRYGIERLLYRLSVSKHANTFLLKGAMLFAVWDDKPHRPTQDLDLLGFCEPDKEALISIFKDIAQTPVEADGVAFDSTSIRADEIREGNSYGGIRVKIMGLIGKAKIPIQIDVGSGDAVTPKAELTTFPALLDFPAPHIRAYPIYTVVAEKIEAAVKLGNANTRMKDFYDLWFLSRRFEFDSHNLLKAIEATFARRNTPLPIAPEPFSEAFINDTAKQTQWTAFLRRNRIGDGVGTFAETLMQIQAFISPVLYRE